jgi:hypothetical protein
MAGNLRSNYRPWWHAGSVFYTHIWFFLVIIYRQSMHLSNDHLFNKAMELWSGPTFRLF